MNAAPQTACSGLCSLEGEMITEFHKACEKTQERVAEGEAFVRQEPTKAMIYAVGVGYFLHFLPIGGIVRGVTGVAVWALRPALLVYGAAKMFSLLGRVCDPCDKECNDSPEFRKL